MITWISRALVTVLLLLSIGVTVYADNVNGGQSDQTKVNNDPTNITGIIDDNAPGWIYNGMVSYDDQNMKNNTGHAGGPGTYAAYTFKGNSIDIYGITGPAIKIDGRAHKMGKARVLIDGTVQVEASLLTKDINYDYNITTINGLKDGNHVVQIEPVGGWIVIDYINVKAASAAGTTNASVKNTAGKGSNVTKGTAIQSANIPEGDYWLIPKHAPDKYLQTVKSGLSNNTRLEIASWNPNNTQLWHVSNLDNGLYKISPSTNPDMALTFVPLSNINMQPQMVIWAYGSYPTQMLGIVAIPSGGYKIISSGDVTECLDVLGGNTSDGASLIGYQFKSGNNQIWAFVPVSDAK